MTWGAYAALSPPLLMAGDVVQFATRETLAALIEPELAQRRLLCINLAALPLNVDRMLKLRIQGVSGEVAVRGRGVYHQSDLLGLQVECEPAIVLALKALAGPQALANVRRAAALRAEAEAAAQMPPPPPEPPPPRPLVPDPASIAPEAPSASGEASSASLDASSVSSASREAPSGASSIRETPTPEPISVRRPMSGDFDVAFEVDAAELPTLVPGDVLDLEDRIELPSSPSLVPEVEPDVGPEAGLWVEPTRVEEPWEVGGLLMQRTEPPSLSGGLRADASPLPRVPSQVPEMPGEPETTRLHGGAGLSAFVGAGTGHTLFRFVADQARKPRSGRLSLSGAGRAFELTLDGRGGVISFTGMAAAPAEHDASELKSERRRRLAEALVPLGERTHLEATLTPERPPLRPGEKPVPLVDALMQWIDLALTPVGSEPATQHYHRHLFHFPILRPVGEWGPTRLPLDRLQGRFVEESLTSGRTLQDILAFSPLGRPRTWRMLVLLDALGMLTFETEAPAAGRQGALHELLDALRLRARQSRQSHFAALGVHFASHPDEFAGALARIVAKYGPGSPVAQGNAETRKLGEEIVARAREASTFLADRGRRQAYRASTLTPMELRAAVDLLIGQFKLATMRKLPELSQQLADVIEELEPGALAAATQG